MKISEIKASAREKLSGNWGRGAFLILGLFLFEFFIGILSGIPGIGLIVSIVSLIFLIPISYGIAKGFFDLHEGKQVSIFDFISTAIRDFSRAWSVAWHIFLKVLIPGLVAFVAALVAGILNIMSAFSYNVQATYSIASFFGGIAGIVYLVAVIYTAIYSLRFSLARFISIDKPELSGKEAVAESAELMKGNLVKFILLNLSFIGWVLLAVISLGIGFFWLIPYMNITMIAFYKSLKKNTFDPIVENTQV